jgi:hypothetical protein
MRPPLIRQTAEVLGSEHGYVRTLFLQATLAMLILAIAINDGGQIVAAQVRAESVARAAATAGADTWYRTRKVERVRLDAQTAAAQVDGTAAVTSVEVARDGKVTVRVAKVANTLVVDRVGFLERFGTQVATDTEVGPAPK